MRKKLFSISVVAVLTVVALAAIPGMAFAGNEMGNCLTPKAGAPKAYPCEKAGKIFTPFTEPVAITTKKVAPPAPEVQLRNEATPANAINCGGLAGQGIVINNAGTALVAENLVLEKCTGVGNLAFCQTVVGGITEKINGTGKIEGEVIAEAITGTEQEVTIKSGFVVACTNGVVGGNIVLGGVTGHFTAKIVGAKPYQFEFVNAKGLVFAGTTATLTGAFYSEEAFRLGDVYQN